ncbi:MAG: ArgE/DapE family deacylase [Candidatus Lokiarchaeota archaeon]|nr:ArgE/DapE family deacylase [Candidatus Lokiarchaeota archaeon]
MDEELIIQEIEENTEEYIQFLRDLIQTESYNPPGNEKNVALMIQQYLEEVDIKSEIFPFGDNRANLIATLHDDFKGKNLLFNGHMDVVPPGIEEEWKLPPLSATIKRKKIFGRGATDMKGGLAALVIALKILKKLRIRLSGNLILNAVGDEETTGELGTKWCLDNKLKDISVDLTLIGEPTNIQPLPHAIMLGERGRVLVKVVTNGISAHAAISPLGKNAIYMMSKIIENLDKLDKYMPHVEPPIKMERLKKLVSASFVSENIFNKILDDQPSLQAILDSLIKSTRVLTMIKGGIKDNVVPDMCEATIDFRLLAGQKVEDVMNALSQLIRNDVGFDVRNESTGDPKDVFVYIEILSASEGSYWEDWENSKDLKLLYKLVSEIYQKKPFYFLYPPSSDAHYLRNTGFCPQTLMFGPGIAFTAHSTNEYIEIQDFLNAIKVYTLFAYNFLK